MSQENFTITGVEEFRANLERVGNPKAIVRVASNALRRAARAIQKTTIERQRSRGVLRTIFARKAKGLRKLTTVSRVRTGGGGIEISIKAKGLASIQETGGRIAPHVIPKAFGTHRARHPGMTHPRIPALTPEIDRSKTMVSEEISKAMSAHIESLGR